ncbi:Aste57867_262 [Aphanomyces stellatus]|uniref:Aste57867_262 protein n=1 Tax=Aphanomyces stellatus TaxID=120398 RepID=A0A485K745_9STRA|nr:hypothetical protein As57867_000262 [Aphanomyces stellatus]VFT77488.1 Aste57867_262 [Aphanomyces stellatus]
MSDTEKLEASKFDGIKQDKEPLIAPKRSRGPPKNEDIWQHFTKLKDAGKYHNYWYVECKSCRGAYQSSAAPGHESDVPEPTPIVSRIPDMRRHLSKCKFVSDFIPDLAVDRPPKAMKGEKGEKKYRFQVLPSEKEEKELRRRDMEHRWDMERRRMALEEQKNARIDQKLARQEDEAQINRRILMAKAQEAELQLKVAQAKARQELLQAGMTHDEIDVVLHRSNANQGTTTSLVLFNRDLLHLSVTCHAAWPIFSQDHFSSSFMPEKSARNTPAATPAGTPGPTPRVKIKPLPHRLEGCLLRDSMMHFMGALRSLDSWKKEQAELAPAVAELEQMSSPFVKSPAARSSDVVRLLEFMVESKVQMNFLIRLPSIEKCLGEWWQCVSQGHKVMTPPMLTSMYAGLAAVLMEARTPSMQQSAVKVLLRSKWCKWDKWTPKDDPPLHDTELHQLIFELGYVTVPTDRLHDYINFFRSTLHKFTAYMDKHGGESKANISERRNSRLQRQELKEAQRRQTRAIVISAAVAPDMMAPPLPPEDDDAEDGAVTGHTRKPQLMPRVTPMTVTQFRHNRTHEPSSQILVADLSLLVPQFQHKFGVGGGGDHHLLLPPDLVPPMHISPVKSMNRAMLTRHPPLVDTPLPEVVKTLDDVERLVASCTKSMQANQQHHQLRHGGGEEDMLRRSMSQPLLRQRLLRR